MVLTGGTEVTATLKGTCTSFTGPVALKVEKSGTTLRVYLKYPPFGSTSTQLDFRITIPLSYAGSLKIDGVSSRILVEDPGFRCTDFKAATVSGDILVKGLVAKTYNVSTTSGTCTLSGIEGTFTGNSVSGDFSVEADAAGAFTVNTVSGDIGLSLPAGSNFDFSFQTVSGSFQSDFATVMEKNGAHDLTGHVGAGGSSVAAHSVSGDFRITSR